MLNWLTCLLLTRIQNAICPTTKKRGNPHAVRMVRNPCNSYWLCKQVVVNIVLLIVFFSTENEAYENSANLQKKQRKSAQLASETSDTRNLYWLCKQTIVNIALFIVFFLQKMKHLKTRPKPWLIFKRRRGSLLHWRQKPQEKKTRKNLPK